jgi:hypothetical protein
MRLRVLALLFALQDHPRWRDGNNLNRLLVYQNTRGLELRFLLYFGIA